MGENLLNKNKYHCSAGLDGKLKQMTELNVYFKTFPLLQHLQK
jgi:hypothetical protein